ncbi:MAG: DUF3011 domain-containing protein [Lysobacterales bacterium]
MSRWLSGTLAISMVAGVAASTGAMAQPGYGYGPGGWRPGPGWDQSFNVRCESQGYGYQMCRVDTGIGGRVSIMQQLSKTPCRQGQTWGWNRAGVWVDGGCAAVFRVDRRWDVPPGNGWQPGPGWDRPIRFSCSSQGYGYQMCRVDTGRGSRVVIERQTSNSPCIEGRTWGWNRAGVWVDQGCAAVFLVDRRWR